MAWELEAVVPHFHGSLLGYKVLHILNLWVLICVGTCGDRLGLTEAEQILLRRICGNRKFGSCRIELNLPSLPRYHKGPLQLLLPSYLRTQGVHSNPREVGMILCSTWLGYIKTTGSWISIQKVAKLGSLKSFSHNN